MAYTVVLLQLRFSGSLQGHFLRLHSRHFGWPVPSSNSKKTTSARMRRDASKASAHGRSESWDVARPCCGWAKSQRKPVDIEDPWRSHHYKIWLQRFHACSPWPTDGGVCPSILGNLSRRGHDDKCRKIDWKYQCLSFCFPSGWSDTNPHEHYNALTWTLPNEIHWLAAAVQIGQIGSNYKLVHVSVLHRWNPPTAYQESGV